MIFWLADKKTLKVRKTFRVFKTKEATMGFALSPRGETHDLLVGR